MTFGTGPQAVVELLASNWDPTRSGRPDVPDVPRDSGGNSLTDDEGYRDEAGTVLITSDRNVAGRNQNVHDLIHCYHPQAGGMAVEDRGYSEQNVVETVQIDIDTADRTDASSGERLSARERMVGDRDDWGGTTPFTVSQMVGDADYPGLFGETKRILETYRRSLKEWDVARHDIVSIQLLNSNARISISVDLEHIAINTADATP